MMTNLELPQLALSKLSAINILIGHDVDEALREIAINIDDAAHVIYVDNTDIEEVLRHIATNPNDAAHVICVDNIDCGLHYTNMASYWNSVVSQMQKFDSQLFCTTHSDEMIEAAAQACFGSQELLKVYRIEKLGTDDVNVVEFDYSALVTAQLAGFEIR